MANPAKSVTGINYGQPGQLTYVPRKDSQSGIGSLHSSRLTSQRKLSPTSYFLFHPGSKG
jgi:hypothetical protein